MGNRLIFPTSAKDPLSRRGGGVRGDGLDRTVGHDLLGELLLGLGEAGAGPPVLRVDLRGKKGGGASGQGQLHKWPLFPPKPTIFRRMTARTAFTVKNPAATIITTATGRWDWSTLMEAIQPLSARDKRRRQD